VAESIIFKYFQSPTDIRYLSGIQPGVRVPPGVRDDILGVRKI
jgi:hypothetical protein